MNKTTTVLLVAVLSFSFALFGCGSDSTTASAQVVTLNQSDAGTTISLHQNQMMTVTLEGNGATGYSWDVEPGAELVMTQQGDGPQFLPDTSAIASGGKYIYTFKATALGTASLNLVYHRRTETGVAPLQTFGVSVVVGS